MNTVPFALLAIQRDWRQLHLHQVPLARVSRSTVRTLLDRIISLKIRLVRCRHIHSRRSKSLRATLLRTVFSGWRATLKKLLLTPGQQDLAISHLRDSIRAGTMFDPNNWALKMVVLDSAVLQNFIPEIRAAAPMSAQNDARDAYWRTLKANLSTAQL